MTLAVILRAPRNPDRLTVKDWEDFIHQIALNRMVRKHSAVARVEYALKLIDEWAAADRNLKRIVVRPDDIDRMEEVCYKILAY